MSNIAEYVDSVWNLGLVLKRDANFISVDDFIYQSNDLNTLSLNQTYLNPYNSQTTISYSIPNSSFAQVQVFYVLGREVSTLLNEDKAVGNFKTNFNASELTSGVYFYRLQAEVLYRQGR